MAYSVTVIEVASLGGLPQRASAPIPLMTLWTKPRASQEINDVFYFQFERRHVRSRDPPASISRALLAARLRPVRV